MIAQKPSHLYLRCAERLQGRRQSPGSYVRHLRAKGYSYLQIGCAMREDLQLEWPPSPGALEYWARVEDYHGWTAKRGAT